MRDVLLDAGWSRTDAHALPVYAAHMVLRQVDWCMRFYDDAMVRLYKELGLALIAAVEG